MTPKPMKLEGTSWQPDWQRRALNAEGEVRELLANAERQEAAHDDIVRGLEEALRSVRNELRVQRAANHALRAGPQGGVTSL